MKLHLILLASLFHLFNGFMVELRGELTEETCTGEEYADFSSCTTLALLGNPILPLSLLGNPILQGQAFINPDVRQLQTCNACPGGSPRGTWCFTVCNARRRLGEDTDKQDSRRLDHTAIFEDGAFEGHAGAVHIGEKIMECFVGENHPCLGSIVSMVVTL
jgi:hypothetical protein